MPRFSQDFNPDDELYRRQLQQQLANTFAPAPTIAPGTIVPPVVTGGPSGKPVKFNPSIPPIDPGVVTGGPFGKPVSFTPPPIDPGVVVGGPAAGPVNFIPPTDPGVVTGGPAGGPVPLGGNTATFTNPEPLGNGVTPSFTDPGIPSTPANLGVPDYSYRTGINIADELSGATRGNAAYAGRYGLRTSRAGIPRQGGAGIDPRIDQMGYGGAAPGMRSPVSRSPMATRSLSVGRKRSAGLF